MTPLRRISIVACCTVLAGCARFGRVNQGQVIENRRSQGLVTLIQDSNYRDPANPKFDILPPVTIHIPRDPREMGPEPQAGKLLSLDLRGGRVAIFDSATQAVRTISCTLLSQIDSVHPNEARVARLPLVDREKKTVTLYVPREHKLVTLTVPEECLGLPDDTWRAGDEIRYYYQDPNLALRLMNVSKTDLNKK